jgi:hypothetical protein
MFRGIAALVLGVVLAGCSGRDGTQPAAPVAERCEFDDMAGGRVEPAAQDILVPPKKKAWEAAFGGEAAARPHVRGPPRGLAGTAARSASTSRPDG